MINLCWIVFFVQHSSGHAGRQVLRHNGWHFSFNLSLWLQQLSGQDDKQFFLQCGWQWDLRTGALCLQHAFGHDGTQFFLHIGWQPGLIWWTWGCFHVFETFSVSAQQVRGQEEMQCFLHNGWQWPDFRWYSGKFWWCSPAQHPGAHDEMHVFLHIGWQMCFKYSSKEVRILVLKYKKYKTRVNRVILAYLLHLKMC